MAVFRDSRQDQLSAGRRMESVANYWTDEGVVRCTTTTINYVSFAGYTGGVSVAFVDANGRTRAVTPVQQFGVDGTKFWWLRSRRTDFWTARPDVGEVGDSSAIVILHGHAPKDRLAAIARQAVEVAKPVVELLGLFKAAT